MEYLNIDFTPPADVAATAADGLALREKYKRGGTAVGLMRAHQLASRQKLSPQIVKQMHKFFQRHIRNKDNKKKNGSPSNGQISWKMWGGDAAFAWASQIIAKIKEADIAIKTKLAKLSDSLDRIGLRNEANQIDNLLKKLT